MFPNDFKKPVPLTEWMNNKGFSQAKAGKYFYDRDQPENFFTASAIQKMIDNDKRDIGVLHDQILVETVKQKVVICFAEERSVNADEIVYLKELKPWKKFGPNPTSRKRGPKLSVHRI